MCILSDFVVKYSFARKFRQHISAHLLLKYLRIVTWIYFFHLHGGDTSLDVFENLSGRRQEGACHRVKNMMVVDIMPIQWSVASVVRALPEMALSANFPFPSVFHFVPNYRSTYCLLDNHVHKWQVSQGTTWYFRKRNHNGEINDRSVNSATPSPVCLAWQWQVQIILWIRRGHTKTRPHKPWSAFCWYFRKSLFKEV